MGSPASHGTEHSCQRHVIRFCGLHTYRNGTLCQALCHKKVVPVNSELAYIYPMWSGPSKRKQPPPLVATPPPPVSYSTAMANPFQSVPFKVISYILSLTDPETVSRVSQTCHALCASIRDDAFLWKYLFAKYFDLPEEHHQSIDWRSQIQSRIRAKHTILAPSSAHIPSEELENALKILIQIVRSAPPGSGHSNNITWANGILTNPDLCATHSPLTSAHPRLSQNLQSQSELQVLECDKLGIPEERFTARAFVYDTRNYRHSNLYGPFMPRVSQNEPLQINYVHLRYLMNVLLNNLRDGHSDDTDMWMKRGFENTRSMTAPPSPVDGDWAGVQGDWMRFAAWVGYEELEEYNVRHYPPSVSKALPTLHVVVAGR